MLRGWAVGSVLVLIQVAWGGPGIAVSGGIQAGANTVPLLFTWSSSITVQGSGWTSGEPVAISLEGPLNSPGVPVSAIGLGSAIAGNLGTFSTPLIVPYDQAITGPKARIPRPGYYRVRATGTVSGTAIASNNINLCPATYTGAGGIDWSRERGSRDGILPGALRAYSPERSDPEWISVWDNRPAQIYGTVGGVTPTGANQVAHISFEDDPLAHYAHDVNAILQPDPQYLWTVGTANYYQNPNEDGTDRPGRIELEWESLNGGNTKTYGTGQIGLPVWATPGTGDRVYVVGRWVLDAGHPEIGDRTEIHPARLIAVMRQRPTVSAGGATSAQVDIYVSGHGGGANQYPSGMDDLLGQGGYGGGRLRDVLNASDQSVYYRPGPLGFPDATALEVLVLTLVGETLSSTPYPSAGPSAFSWGAPAPEQQPINDMDYDFDVPLPPPPDGATSVKVEVITQAQHTTAVAETVTFPKAGGSLPAVAHVHLPYNGADNGIYARTLKFSWNTASMPEYHFRVRLDRIRVNSNPGEWHLWSDAGGQWTNLSNLAPSLLQTTQNGIIAPPGAQFDLYLRGTDTIRFLVQGYRAQCIDHEFGALFGMSSYSAGIKLLTDCGPVNNDDLGGALLELPALPSSQGSYTVMADSTDRPGGGSFQVDLTVDFVSGPSASAECQGRGLLAPVISAAG
ncbi:MAG TPA: hypothetical protein VG456_03785, partial [Candidatus Sulfopaludibacter sp.]|nr:hypothetical protein [Candidatus Sulfopaludibacter sp.]